MGRSSKEIGNLDLKMDMGSGVHLKGLITRANGFKTSSMDKVFLLIIQVFIKELSKIF